MESSKESMNTRQKQLLPGCRYRNPIKESEKMTELKPCPFCGCRDRRVGIRRMGSNGYRVCCSRCGSLGPHVSVKEWNGQKEIAQKKAIEKWNERL